MHPQGHGTRGETMLADRRVRQMDVARERIAKQSALREGAAIH